jgi:hypothetical protein
MTLEQKMIALKALVGGAGFDLKMRSPGNWYCHLPGVEIKDGSMLTSPTDSSGTPELAIARAWVQHTCLSPSQYLVLNAYGPNRRAVRWNGFMWEDISETKS